MTTEDRYLAGTSREAYRRPGRHRRPLPLFGTPGTPPIPHDLKLALIRIKGEYDITKQMVVFECKTRWGAADIGVWNDNGWKLFFGVDIHGINIASTSVPLIGKTARRYGRRRVAQGDRAGPRLHHVDRAAKPADQRRIEAGYPKPPAGGCPPASP